MPEPSSDQLERYFASALPELRGPFEIRKTSAGQSNPTYILSGRSGKCVLRRKPDGALLPAAHAIDREYRVMRALEGTGVAVPRMLHHCTDPEILGTEFFVMEFVEGLTLNDPRCADMSGAQRTAVYANMNAMLARLHAVDVASVGLSDFGKPGNYFARQLSRWTKAYRASETEPIPEMEELIAWLAATPPPENDRTTLVHGDWRLDNLLVDGRTGEIRAVVDWELSTLGHPFADLAAQLMQWAMPPGELGRGLAGVDRAALGLPTDEAYIRLYAKEAERKREAEIGDLRKPGILRIKA
ncbi:MAG: phosphotransferase family protein, partial [Pseudomonadota bacterium]